MEGSEMDLFEQVESMGHERVLVCSNPDVGLRAIIAVHSTVLGPGLGGVRMWPYASSDEALTDVLRLSRGMTYKAAAAGLNLGGGKAVIIGDAKKDKTEELLRCFGQYVESLGGLYITAEDVGTDMDDMDQIQGETRWVTGVSPDRGGGGDPSAATAFGILQGIRAALEWSFGSDSLSGKAFAVQGLGSVGLHLCRYLTEQGAKVFGADLDPQRGELAKSELGIEIVPAGEILSVPCDVLAPCALGAVLNPTTIPQLRCRIIAGAANNQLADEERDSAALQARGILYAPDFVLNAGGLIHVYNELVGYNRDTVLRMTGGLYRNMMRVFEIAKRNSLSTMHAAHRVAEERIARVRMMRPRYWVRSVHNTR
jgi:leucine dehydrogenase